MRFAIVKKETKLEMGENCNRKVTANLEFFVKMQDLRFGLLLKYAKDGGIDYDTNGIPFDFTITDEENDLTMHCREIKYASYSSFFKFVKFVLKYNLDVNFNRGVVEVTYNN